MSDIKRYDIFGTNDGGEMECEDPTGRYVRYDDHAAELTRLRTANAALRAECVVAREYNKLRNAKRGTGVLAGWQRRLSKARQLADSTPGAMEGANG